MNRFALAAAAALAATLSLTTLSANATEPTGAPISVGEVAEGSGIDSASIRDAAEGEIRQIDASKLPLKKRYLVSLSFRRSTTGDNVACTVNAMLRDAKTGVMIAIIEAGAHSAGTTSEEASRRVAQAAVRSAMRRIPTALAAK